MATTTKNSKQTLVSQCGSLVTGITALTDTSFLLDGGTVAKADVLSPLQAYVDADKEVIVADASYRAAVAKAHAAEPAARAMVGELKPYLRSRYGQTNPALKSQFGVEPAKPRVVPVAKKAAGAVKAKATRTAKKAAVASATAAPAPEPAPTTGGATAAGAGGKTTG